MSLRTIAKGANPIAKTQVLLRNHLAARQSSFNLAHLNDGIALVHAFDCARHDGLISLEKVIEHLLTLSIANTLQDRLLSRLSTNAPKLYRLKRLFDVLPDLDIRN